MRCRRRRKRTRVARTSPPETVEDDAGADDGPPRKGAAPERTCIATRTRRPASELIRFALAPDGTVTPDLARKLPGRGVWVTATREAVECPHCGEPTQPNLLTDGSVVCSCAAERALPVASAAPLRPLGLGRHDPKPAQRARTGRDLRP